MQLLFALRNLGRNKRRSIAIMTTIAVGCCCLQVFQGFNSGLMTHFRENAIRQRYGNGLLNLKGYREKVFERPWEHWISNFSEAYEKLVRINGVENLYPRVSFSALLQNSRFSRNGQGQGVEGSESQFFTTMNMIEGHQLATGEAGIILGSGLARALTTKVGDSLTITANTINGTINGIELPVVGIFHTGAKRFDDVMFRIPLKYAQNLLDTNLIENVAVGLKNPELWPTFASEAQRIMPEWDATPFESIDKIYYGHAIDWLNSQFRIVFTIIVAVVTLGILNAITSNILDRKQELGNLRANGESRTDVFGIIALEAILMGAMAALMGIGLALIISKTILSKGIEWPPGPGMTLSTLVHIEINEPFAAFIVAFGITCSLLGTVLAGLRVMRMTTAEMLRSM